MTGQSNTIANIADTLIAIGRSEQPANVKVKVVKNRRFWNFGQPIGWGKLMQDDGTIVLAADRSVYEYESKAIDAWCTECLGNKGERWGTCGLSIYWFKANTDATVFLLQWQRQAPPMEELTIRFLPELTDASSSVFWHKR